MNPIQLARTLQQILVSYLTTTFDVNRDGQEPELAAAIAASFNRPGALFHGPYLELTPPYRTQDSLEDLCRTGVLTGQLLDLECFEHGEPLPADAPLFVHQVSAIHKLCQKHRNVVISSGTGSGKTECFLIPILNDLLLDNTPGVRALLVYPMNALVNDQLDRLRRVLRGTNITFGRYTSELAHTEEEARHHLDHVPLPNEVVSREVIHSGKQLPQILITNYAMLEYLLLRPNDSILFQSGLWRFIVLDEAHTYTGAQGIEVAHLMRRLKHRLGRAPGETLCVATSATLTGDDDEAAAAFGETLFGEPFDVDDVIFGEINTEYVSVDVQSHPVPIEAYTDPRFDALLEDIRRKTMDTTALALRLHEIGLVDDEMLNLADTHQGEDLGAFLWYTLRGNRKMTVLRCHMLSQRETPMRVEAVAGEVFGEIHDPVTQQEALYNLIELGAMARPAADKPSLLPARYHLFARPPQGIWVCLNPDCVGRDPNLPNAAGWSRMFSTKRRTCDACGCMVYPLSVCRTCGQVYVRMHERNRTYLPEADELSGDTNICYFTWKPIVENLALSADSTEDDEAQIVQEQQKTPLLQVERRIRLNPDQDGKPIMVELHQVSRRTTRGGGVKDEPVGHLNECLRCHDRGLKDTEIATPISVTGSTPLSVLAEQLYRELPISPDPNTRKKPGAGRKLLTFYDSRQGAARFAAFLQDAVNQRTYRHLIPHAVQQHQERKDYLPDLDLLADDCTEMAWRYRIFHNDAMLQDFNRKARRMSRAERERLTNRIKTEILAEFTTRRSARQSLEALGLVTVEYFEPGDEPDFSALAKELRLPPNRTRSLIENLLDGLRRSKIVTLPQGVQADDEVFGRNKFEPRLVRRRPGSYEVAWIGETQRQRRRAFVEAVLRRNGLPAEEADIVHTLETLWEWLVDESDLMDGQPSAGYRLCHNRLFFRTDSTWYRCRLCQRLGPRPEAPPCPNPHCTGVLEPIEIELGQPSNFYYEAFRRDLIPMRVEEHTAQLDPVKGREYQTLFKNGEINVLSCSTTFEMGIDLGDLQAVVMSNVPPTVANYRQRAGRAGRRASGTAFILTWAADRPHDQTYFNAPEEIISGQVQVPCLNLDNQFIRRRHINAILLSLFLRHRRAAGSEDLHTLGGFFDPDSESKHYSTLVRWQETKREHIRACLSAFAPCIDLDDGPVIDTWLVGFINEMARLNMMYLQIAGYYQQTIDECKQEMLSASGKQLHELTLQINRYDRLLTRLRRERLINYLSDKGMLPSYSFPLYTVELMLPPDKALDAGLRLQRDLRQAIREYAPGSEVVADKRIWRSDGLVFFRQTPQIQEYRICHTCNYLEISEGPGVTLSDCEQCPVCGDKKFARQRNLSRFVEPDGFRTDPKSGSPAGQFVHREPNQTRSALLPRKTSGEQQLGEIIKYSYERNGELLYVNEGVTGKGFHVCQICGKVRHNAKACNRTDCPAVKPVPLALGHVQTTDTLHLRFESASHVNVPEPHNLSFWLSLMYALLQGASRALQIERRDLDGVLAPRGTAIGWEQTIVLYDNVPGGAGHVKRISEYFEKVLTEALRTVNCPDCGPETSCYHCLRDYSNQTFHHLLQRREVVRFLDVLQASLRPVASDVLGAGYVAAVNLSRWAMQQIEQASSQLYLAADRVTGKSPLDSPRNWLDVLQDLLQRGVSVDLYLKELPGHQPSELSIARHLQVLIDKGLHLWQLDALPVWSILIDPDDAARCRAIRQNETNSFILNKTSGIGGLITTIHREGVQEVYRDFKVLPAYPLAADVLDPPANVQVINIRNDERYTEDSLFESTFAHPVQRLMINDRYLNSHYKLVDRVGAYIRLAARHDRLERVDVRTRPGGRGASDEQERAIRELNQLFDNLIQVKYDHHTEHDRYIEITRTNGTQVRILIGKGLDFIRPDGTTEATYIVIEDPYVDD